MSRKRMKWIVFSDLDFELSDYVLCKIPNPSVDSVNKINNCNVTVNVTDKPEDLYPKKMLSSSGVIPSLADFLLFCAAPS